MRYLRPALATTALYFGLALGCATQPDGSSPEETRLRNENERLARENKAFRDGFSRLDATNTRLELLLSRANTADLRSDVQALRTELRLYVDSSLAPITTRVNGAVVNSNRALDTATRLELARTKFEEQAATLADIGSALATIRERHRQLRNGLEEQENTDLQVQQTRERYQTQILDLEQRRAAYVASDSYSAQQKETFARETETRIAALRREQTEQLSRITAPRRREDQ